ncbi:MAG: hypothetical protein JSV19_05175 [Phycisphaerales bacterium]|nr:MAG: hypothetical protein JSV19_05175 [Phycisphaerales bacterium]
MERTKFRISGLFLAMLAAPVAVSGQPYEVGTTFTYQGQLKDAGEPVSDTCDFEFELYDAAAGGSQVGGTASTNGVNVINGLFTVSVDFGEDRFTGEARWLEVSVQCPGDAGFTTLSPRQALAPTPYALALPGLWTQQNATSPNLIGGHSSNSVTSGVMGATIGGGGASFQPNQVTDSFGTIGGGWGNQAGNDDGDVDNARWGTVCGGQYHEASGQQSTVGGGWFNESSGAIATIAGGGGNIASARAATVGGGWLNEVAAEYGTIAGGGASVPADDATRNRVFDDYGTIGGGGYNQAGGDDADPTSATYATVAGGQQNSASAEWSTVGGGRINNASGRLSTIGGGDENTASGQKTTVGGGAFNVASLDGATVGGGLGNAATNYNATVVGGGSNNATGDGSTVCGGAGNEAGGFRSIACGGLYNTANGDTSFAAGRRAKANHHGTFVWADQTDTDFASTGQDQFLIRAAGGVGIGTDSPTEALTVLGNLDVSGDVVAGGDIQVSANIVNSGMPISSEQSTSSTSFVQLTTFDIPDQNTDHLVTMNVRFHARGQSSGETVVFLVRGFSYGDGATADLADHYGGAPILGVIQVRNSSYADYHLNLGPYALTDNQRWRFIVFYRTRNGSYPAYIDQLEWEARSIRYEY